MNGKAKIGVLGASGYTGAETVRLLLAHPRADIVLLTADRRAGQEMRTVFPQFSPYKLPKLVSLENIDWPQAGLDLAVCALPHATTQKVVKALLAAAPKTKVVDISADFRLRDQEAYAKWYVHEHHAPDLQKEAVYGLVEVYRDEIKKARLVANPGCYATSVILALRPLIEADCIAENSSIVCDCKSGASGAGKDPRRDLHRRTTRPVRYAPWSRRVGLNRLRVRGRVRNSPIVRRYAFL